jgi:hypothetical protein
MEQLSDVAACLPSASFSQCCCCCWRSGCCASLSPNIQSFDRVQASTFCCRDVLKTELLALLPAAVLNVSHTRLTRCSLQPHAMHSNCQDTSTIIFADVAG